MSKSKLVKNLLEMSVMGGILVSSWLVAERLMGYPWQVGVIMGAVLVAALKALLHGLNASESMGGLGTIVVLTMLLVWNEQSVMSPISKYAWTTALIAVPLAAYVLGRVINKRSNVRQSVS